MCVLLKTHTTHILTFMTKTLLFTALLVSSWLPIQGQEPDWEDLFNGKDLDGWVRMGGKARFEVSDSVIVGTTAEGTPNSFLCTDRTFGNFILEFEFKADPELNCGVQFRSGFTDGLVRGYQYEIDPDRETMYSGSPANIGMDGKEIAPGKQPRSWTGGIYEEKLRGWIGDLSEEPLARDAFRPGEWNKARVEAFGDRISTWINGVPAARIIDFASPDGFIALQVHATDSEKPYQVRYRNIRIKDFGPNPDVPDRRNTFISEWIDEDSGKYAKIWMDKATGAYRASLYREAFINETPEVTVECFRKDGMTASFMAPGHWSGRTDGKTFTISRAGKEVFRGKPLERRSPTLGMEAPEGAEVLFDGTSLDKWYRLDPKVWTEGCGDASESAVIAPGGRLSLVPRPGKNGSIITRDTYSDFFLHVEFRVPEDKATNGGVYLLSLYELNIKDGFSQEKGSCCGAFGNVAAPEYPEPEYNWSLPPMVWQTMDIDFTAPRFDADGKKISCARVSMSLNGRKVYDNVEIEKLKGAVGRKPELAEGPVYLQEHGTAYQFRNIWIMDKGNR